MLGRRITGIRYLAAAGELFERASILERLLDEAARQAEDLGAECLVHRSYADDAPAIHALERRGFLLMDTLVDYRFDFPRKRASQSPRACRQTSGCAWPREKTWRA